jgi:hypothetical protein
MFEINWDDMILLTMLGLVLFALATVVITL